MCFCFLFSIAPHFPHLPIWVSALVLAVLLWRCLQNIGKLPELPRWLLIPLVIVGGLGVFAEYWTVVGRDAGLALLTVMASLKFMESRRHRDLLILVFLCYFLIATHFLFSQSIPTAVMMFVTLIVITATLITLNQRTERLSVPDLLRSSTHLVLLSIPLMLILFVLVPRVPGPLWGLSNEQRGGITGLSDQMSPGQISNLIRNNEVAFRVEFDAEVPPQNQLYWRGPVMARYDGYSWSQMPRRSLKKLAVGVSEPAISYTVTLEPNGKRWLLALDVPTKPVKNSMVSRDFQLVSKTQVNDLLRYSTESRLQYSFGANENRDYLTFTLRYPQSLNPKTVEFGKSLAARFDNSQDIVNEVLTMFRQEAFYYTLQPPILGEDSVDDFCLARAAVSANTMRAASH